MQYRTVSTGLLLGATLLGLGQFNVVKAEEQVEQHVSVLEQHVSLPLVVQSQLRVDGTAIDSTISLPKPLTKAVLAKIEIKNAAGMVVNTLNYDVGKGPTRFTCWFGLRGFAEGEYTVEVTVQDGGVTYKGQSQPVLYQNKPKMTEKSLKQPETEVPKVTVTEQTYQISSATLFQEAKVSEVAIVSVPKVVPNTVSQETEPMEITTSKPRVTTEMSESTSTRRQEQRLLSREEKQKGGFSMMTVFLFLGGLCSLAGILAMLKSDR